MLLKHLGGLPGKIAGGALPRVRLIPIVLVATTCLLVLKTAGLITYGGYTLTGLPGAHARDGGAQRSAGQPSWAQDVFGYPRPDAAGEDAPIVTGSVDGKPAEPADAPPPEGRGIPVHDGPRLATGERAVLERLQERRQELERRARELDVREGLVEAAEQRLEARLGELRQIEARIDAATQQQDAAEQERFKSIVAMYENMKPKDAARIFDRLDPGVLLEVARNINPRRMSDILAQMMPAVAQRLTVELAARSAGSAPGGIDHLPKIQGRPSS